ncbi:MAG: hypothetical protein ABI205_02775 [Gemmatimonadaceae bacterium]
MKTRIVVTLAIASFGVVACSHDATSPASAIAVSLASAYSVVPSGFSELSSTFVAGSTPDAFHPDFGRGRGGPGGHDGFGPPGSGPGFGLGLMGGGLDGPFFGDGIGRDFFHPDNSCAYSASAGTVTCGPMTHDGLTVTRVSTYTSAAGVAQPKLDSTTNTVASSVTVTGTTTRTRRDSSGTGVDSSTSTVNESSNQSVSGLAAGSTARMMNGTSSGSESTTGTSSQGAFTATRFVGDTTSGLVVPAQSAANAHPYPTAGTITRSMWATVAITGQAAATSKRREVITYDGSATAKVVITVDGTAQNCTLPLPHGRLACS